MAVLAKWRRRGQSQHYPLVLSALGLGGLAFYLTLFFLPAFHGFLVAAYGLCIGLSAWLLIRFRGLDLFHGGLVTSKSAKSGSSSPWMSCQIATWLTFVPLAYLGGLIKSLGELQSFSVQWPSQVYVDALFWSLAVLPLAVLLGFLLWRSALPSSMRTVLTFFGSLFILAWWLIFWEALDNQMLAWLWGGTREPLFFQPWSEEKFRDAVKIFFYASGSLLGLGYLMLAPSAAVLVRRGLFLGLPAGLAYGHMLFFLGDWNYYLGALQSALLREQHLQGYAFLAGCKAARVPEAFRTPYDLEELAEYRYQRGDTAAALELWKRMELGLANKPYAGILRQRAHHYVRQLTESDTSAGPADMATLELPLRLIKPTSYLDGDWYALLSAIGYLRPLWSDMDLMKRLLTVSPDLRMNLPALTGVPVLRSVLDRLDVPHRLGFVDGKKLHEALSQNRVPVINLSGMWTAIAGFDAARNAYEIYRYPDQYEHNPWWRAPELDVLAASVETTSTASGSFPQTMVPVRRSIPAPELERSLHDIGGVAVFLGDTAWTSAREDRAAFLAELGDDLYQEQDNDRGAAEAYSQAYALWPNDYIACRILYLRRRWQQKNGDAGDFTRLFDTQGPPAWARHPNLDSSTVTRVISRIISGGMGQYLLLNWVAGIPPKGSELHRARLDSARTAYRLLRAMEPGQGLYLDTLAALAHRFSDYALEADYLDTLALHYPFGDEGIQFRLAWAAYLAKDKAKTLRALRRCPSFEFEARYELMAGAMACWQGQRKSGRRHLEKSLKLDKSEPRIHEEWMNCQEPGGEGPDYLKAWVERTR